MELILINKKNLWENFLLKYSPQSLFQSWSWGEVEKTLKRRVWRVGMFRKTQSRLRGISQIVKVEARRGSFLQVRHGPIFKKGEREIIKEWLEWIKELARKEKVRFIRISPLISKTEEEKWRRIGFRQAPIHNMDGQVAWRLPLDKNREELLKNMRKTTRYLIKKGEKMGLEIIRSQDLNKFLKLYQKTSQRHGFVPHRGIKKEYKIFQKDKQADLFLVKYKKKILAAALIIYYGNQAIYHHGASIPSSAPASYLLQWRAILEAKKRGLKYYNFWGIAQTKRKSHPWWGLTLFKRGFGGEKVEYAHAQDLPLKKSYWLTYLIERFRKFWRRY